MTSRALPEIKINELIAFAADHPIWPAWPPDMIRRFLTGLISGPEMVIELMQHDRCVALAVLLDRIENAGNHACLEVLAMAANADYPTLLGDIVEKARRRLPADKAGFQVTLHHPEEMQEDWFRRHRLTPRYEMFEMICENIVAPGDNSRSEISEATPANYREVYDVMKISFHDNEDTSVPAFEEWEPQQYAPSRKIFIYRSDHAIEGFVRVTIDGNAAEAEINTLGVLQTVRGRGIGRALLSVALNKIAQNQIKMCRLQVAAKNSDALGLYQSLGFSISDSSAVYIGAPP